MEFVEKRCGCRWVGLALLILVVGSCGGAAPPSGPAEIPSPVNVDGLSPSDGETDFSRSASLEIPFTEPMNRESVEAAFSLSSEAEAAALMKSQSVSGTFTWNSDDTAMTFDPATALEPLTRYCMRIAAGALTADGDEIAAFESCFTTSGGAANLDGTWFRSCYSRYQNEEREDTFVATGGGTSLTMTEDYYESGSSCTVPLYRFETSSSAVSQGLSSDVEGTEKMAVTTSSEVLTPLGATMVTEWNSATPSGFCGFTDWTVGTGKDIIGNGTESSWGSCWGLDPDSVFNILIYVNENADPDTLQLGDDTTCTGEFCEGSEFPTALQLDVFIKQ